MSMGKSDTRKKLQNHDKYIKPHAQRPKVTHYDESDGKDFE